jgi:hypothetical protein
MAVHVPDQVRQEDEGSLQDGNEVQAGGEVTTDVAGELADARVQLCARQQDLRRGTLDHRASILTQ